MKESLFYVYPQLYIYMYIKVCVCTHTCATHTHAHTEPGMRNFLLSYCSVNLSNSQNNSGFLVELSCFPGSEISSFLLKTLWTQELDLSQKHAPCRLGFIVLERAMQAAMAEKQSTVLPSWDTYEPQQWLERQGIPKGATVALISCW